MAKKERIKPSIRRVERQYGKRLREIARNVGDIVSSFGEITPANLPTVQRLLDAYADGLHVWATHTAHTMLKAADKADETYWRKLSADMSKGIKQTLKSANVEPVMLAMVQEQVELIKSLPREASARVGKLTQEAMVGGSRANQVAAEILRTGEVTVSRANLIARTEVARTASKLTEARAQAAGSVEYIWRTAGDSDVRPGHKAMNGKVCQWADPPAVDENGKIMHHHPGAIWNCRCYGEPIIAD